MNDDVLIKKRGYTGVFYTRERCD